MNVPNWHILDDFTVIFSVWLFYSPWPEQALRANIHCQISLALNRIYTEWYPSKGYTFNITNSTSYDQYYVHGRTVFDVMVRITDDIFNTYIRKTGTVNPYYSEYCDGKSVTCPGLKQWGTVTLANQGRNALQILKYYYGNDIEIIRTSNIQSIPQSYPGSPIRQGDSGTAVFTLQRQLNRITKDYPFLGLLTVDGVFGAKMAATVRAFQKQFNLTADGVVGRQAWYKISYIYVSVKDLAELTSEGEVSSGTLSDGTWGGTVLRTGSTGSAVEQLQFWLNTLAQYESSIPSLTVDGVYGTGTANTVRAFQRKYGLTVDGVVGRDTWTAAVRPVPQHPVRQRHPQCLPRHRPAGGCKRTECAAGAVLAQDRAHGVLEPEQHHGGRQVRQLPPQRQSSGSRPTLA